MHSNKIAVFFPRINSIHNQCIRHRFLSRVNKLLHVYLQFLQNFPVLGFFFIFVFFVALINQNFERRKQIINKFEIR